jgi:2'-5' RNA ligase
MDLWNTETPISEIPGLEIDIPDWIEGDISPSDVASIAQGGCASGAYMPAVTYHQALKTMGEHGDDVLQYIEDRMGELPQPPSDVSWSGLACFYLSRAVELWTSGVADTLESFEPEEGEAP